MNRNGKGEGKEKEKKRKRKRKGKGEGKGKGKEKDRKRKRREGTGKGWKRKRKGKEKGRKQEKERKGSICGLGLLFEQMGIAKVSLEVSLISPLARTQLCAKQLEMWTSCTVIGIAFGGWPIATHSIWSTFQTQENSPLQK